MSAIAEVLPPERAERDAKGRFQEGASGNPNGKPPGALSWNTRAVRDAMMEALDAVSGGDGGKNYFMVIAATKPELFLPMLAKCMPIKLAGDDDGDPSLVVTRVERLVIARAK